MNIKKGAKRIFLSFGYLFCILIGGNCGSQEGNIYATVFGCVIGFFVFKYIIIGCNWIIQGFTGKDEE